MAPLLVLMFLQSRVKLLQLEADRTAAAETPDVPLDGGEEDVCPPGKRDETQSVCYWRLWW